MKKKIYMTISTLMLFIPWTILIFRMFDWALKTPVAQIMACAYGAFMVFSFIFTLLAYTQSGVKNPWMQICLVITGVYAVGAIALMGMMIVGLF